MIRTFNRFRKTFAANVATEHFRPLERYDIVRNAQMCYDRLAKLVRMTP